MKILFQMLLLSSSVWRSVAMGKEVPAKVLAPQDLHTEVRAVEWVVEEPVIGLCVHRDKKSFSH